MANTVMTAAEAFAALMQAVWEQGPGDESYDKCSDAFVVVQLFAKEVSPYAPGAGVEAPRGGAMVDVLFYDESRAFIELVDGIGFSVEIA